MIPKSAIRSFMARKRRDWRGAKEWTDAQINARMSTLPVRPPIWNVLQRHQKICFLIAVRESSFVFMLDTGMGKTLLSIAIHRYYLKLKLVQRTLVIVPQNINKYGWELEVEKHSQSKIQVLAGPTESKWEQLRSTDADLVVTTMAGLMRMVGTIKEVKRRGKAKVNKLVRSPRLMRHLAAYFQGVIIDESTMMKNKGTHPYRIVRQLRKVAKFTFLLTGTPIGGDPEDLWAQLWLVDGGHTLGETLGLYRAAFFTEKQGWFGGTEYTFNKKLAPALNEFIANKSLRYRVKDSDLPRVIPVLREVRLPTDAMAYYDRAKEKLIAAHGNYQEQNNAFIRMLQISSGFLGYGDDETGLRAKFEFKPNPKLELLISDIQSIPADRKVIVFHNFIHSGDMIVRELKKVGVGFLRIGGGMKDVASVLRQFNKVAKYQVLVLGNDAGGFGLNLQIAQYGLRFEAPVGAILEKQAKRRFIRQFSEHDHVFLYDYIVRGTRDQHVRDMHIRAGVVFDAVIEGR